MDRIELHRLLDTKVQQVMSSKCVLIEQTLRDAFELGIRAAIYHLLEDGWRKIE